MLKIGHRGAMGYAPENTLLSFEKAIDLGVDMVELDVYRCKSGELVVIHDRKVDRTTDGHGFVEEMTLKELKLLNAGQGENIPTLEEVLDRIKARVSINIELKGSGTAEPVYELLEKYIKSKDWTHNDFLISSFNHYELKRFNSLKPKIKIGALIEAIPIGYAEFAQKVNAYSVNVSLEFINKEFIDDAHARKMKVFVWVVNDVKDIRRMKDLGVDGIFSNYPDRL